MVCSYLHFIKSIHNKSKHSFFFKRCFLFHSYGNQMITFMVSGMFKYNYYNVWPKSVHLPRTNDFRLRPRLLKKRLKLNSKSWNKWKLLSLKVNIINYLLKQQPLTVVSSSFTKSSRYILSFRIFYLSVYKC